MITNKHIFAWLHKSAEVIFAHSQELTKLDSAIGDADHGTNMKRGFEAVLKAIDQNQDIGGLLKSTAMALISKVGGASGPLYGTIYLQCATALRDKETLEASDIETMLNAAIEGIKMRGKAEPDDKTMLDAWLPAREAFNRACSEGSALVDALRAMAQGAEEGMRATTPLIARKGRASYLGERSRGHQDPGATSTALILGALAEACEQ